MADTEHAPVDLVSLPEAAPIRFFDLKAQQATIRPALEARWATILDHGRYIGGPEVEELERALCEFTGAVDAVAVGSGTQALIMPMIGLGLSYGDAVFIPGFTYNATANAVLLAGATPVLVDIDPDTFNMCPKDLERRIGQVARQRNLRAKAVMPVDLYGVPADYDAIGEVADKYGLQVISDAAQSFGGQQNGKWVGTLAPITATSFYPTKTLGGYGDGGAILTADTGTADMLRSVRWHGTGQDRKNSIRVGMNGRCDSIQCAVVCEKLKIFNSERARRNEIKRLYDAALADHLALQIIPPGTHSACGLYTVRVPNRDRVREDLSQMGIPTGVYYDTPLHRMPAFEHFTPAGGLPECEKASGEVLSLPMHPYLSASQVERICSSLLKILRPLGL